MTNNEEFAPEELNEQNQRLIQELSGMYRISAADARSLGRIRERLSKNSENPPRTFQQHVMTGTQQESSGYMNTSDAHRNFAQNRIWQRRIGTIAAALFVTLLVGSFIILLNLSYHSSTGKHENTPTSVVTVPPTTTSNRTPTPTRVSGRPVMLSSIHMIDKTTGWAITTEEHIIRTTDGGTSWKDVTPKYPANAALTPVGIGTDFLSGDLAWLAVSQIEKGNSTYPSTVFRTVDGGQTWQSAMLPNNELGVSQVIFVDAQNGWVISSLGGGAAGSEAVDIFHTTDGGKTWVRVTHVQPTNGNNSGALPLGGDKSGFSFVNASTGWAAGFTPVDNFVWLYVTHDSGVTWQHQTLPFPSNRATAQVATMPPVFFTASDGILLATFEKPNGSSSYYYVTHDGGLTWGGPRQTPVFVSMSPSFIDMQHGWVIGGDTMTLYATQDGGQHWTKFIPSSNFKNVYLLDFVSTETGWAIGGTDPNTTFLLKTEDGGHTWITIHPTVSG